MEIFGFEIDIDLISKLIALYGTDLAAMTVALSLFAVLRSIFIRYQNGKIYKENAKELTIRYSHGNVMFQSVKFLGAVEVREMLRAELGDQQSDEQDSEEKL